MLGLTWIAAFIVGLVADWKMVSNWLAHNDHAAIGWLFLSILCSGLVMGLTSRLAAKYRYR